MKYSLSQKRLHGNNCMMTRRLTKFLPVNENEKSTGSVRLYHLMVVAPGANNLAFQGCSFLIYNLGITKVPCRVVMILKLLVTITAAYWDKELATYFLLTIQKITIQISGILKNRSVTSCYNYQYNHWSCTIYTWEVVLINVGIYYTEDLI